MIERMRLVFWFLFLLLFHCRFLYATPPPLVVLLGGYNSCKSADSWGEWLQGKGNPRTMQMMHEGLTPILKKYRERYGEELPYFASCFNGRVSRKIYFTHSYTEKTRQVHWKSTRLLFEEIRAFIAEVPNRVTYILGHSYGGWLALKLSQHLEAKHVKLITLDPINPETCNQWSFLQNLFWTRLGYPANASCSAFAMGSQTMKRLAKKYRNRWQNYYQLAYKALHSIPIDGASNAEIKGGKNDWFGEAHIEAGIHTTPWKDFENKILFSEKKKSSFN